MDVGAIGGVVMARQTQDLPFDPGELSVFFEELVEVVRPIALAHFRTPLSIEQKGDLSPVTIVDQQIEAVLRDMISARFPEHGIVGEETADRAGTGYVWYIDPIDGTKSFISGMPLFGTLVALVEAESGRPVAGMIDMPALGETWCGMTDETRFNGTLARVSQCTTLETAQIYTSSPDIFAPKDWAGYDRLSRQARYRRFGGDCYLYGLLASGHCDLVVETSLYPFDYMALVPVVEGAGGVIRDWNGRELTPASDGRVIAAASMSLLEQSLSILCG